MPKRKLTTRVRDKVTRKTHAFEKGASSRPAAELKSKIKGGTKGGNPIRPISPLAVDKPKKKKDD